MTPRTRAARPHQWSRGARVLWQVLLLSLILSLGSAVPLMLWHNQQMNAVGESRATAVVNWLAADAATAMSTGRDVTLATEQIAGEPGVVSARVLMLDGRVIAPAARSAERVEYIPGIEAAPGDVLRVLYRVEWRRTGDRAASLHAAIRARPSRGSRSTPTSEFGGSSAAVTAPIVLVSILIGWIVAILITRSTMRSLNALNEDVELALERPSRRRRRSARRASGARPRRHDQLSRRAPPRQRHRYIPRQGQVTSHIRVACRRFAGSRIIRRRRCVPPHQPHPHPPPATPRVPHRFRNRPHQIRQRRVPLASRRAASRGTRIGAASRRLKCWKRAPDRKRKLRRH